MMNNLFQMFDPSSNNMSLNWLSLYLPLLLSPNYFYHKNNRKSFFINFSIKFILKDLKTNINKENYKSMIMFSSLFSLIFILNFMSIFPFIFAPTSHISLSLLLSLPIWMGLTLQNWANSPKKMLIHLVPLNTPLFLCMFMVVIETISNTIRPLTLSIRLTANMIAGHILINLLSNLLNNNVLIYFFSALTLNSLILLEISVCVIQSYVFIVLTSLYLGEMN